MVDVFYLKFCSDVKISNRLFLRNTEFSKNSIPMP